MREGRLYKIDVYLDSPLAEEVTRIYVAHPECFDDEARRLFTGNLKDYSMRLHFVRSVEDSMKLNRVRSGCIIIAGSGMCEGGRIRHHLKHNLWRSECGIIFVGYQAEGTLGRRLVDGAKAVSVLGEQVVVKAPIYTINGFSAHAGREELLDWLAAFNDSPEVYMVHGEKEARDSLCRPCEGQVRIQSAYAGGRGRGGVVGGWCVYLPRLTPFPIQPPSQLSAPCLTETFSLASLKPLCFTVISYTPGSMSNFSGVRP